MDEKEIIFMVERIGVSCTFLVFFVWATYKGFSWLGSNIILPLHERHIKFIDRLESSIENVVQSQATTMIILNQILLSTRELEEIKREKKGVVNV